MFVLFGVQHVFALCMVSSLCLAAFMLARHGGRGRGAVGWSICASAVAFVAVMYYKRLSAGDLQAAYDLPLHLCDIVIGLCIVMTMRPRPLLFELIYFWGLAGAVLALITPDLSYAFPSWWFIAFFWGHGVIVLTVAYGLGCGLEPRPGGPLRAFIGLNVYALVVGLLDFAFEWNYGYLRALPQQKTLLDALGPWPWYIASIEGIAVVSFVLLDTPWRMRGQRRSATAE